MQSSTLKEFIFDMWFFICTIKKSLKKKTQKIHADIKKTYLQDFFCSSFGKKWVSRFDKGDYDLEIGSLTNWLADKFALPNCLPPNCLASTFKTITLSILESANSIWSPFISNTNKKLQTIQNTALCIATGCT